MFLHEKFTFFGEPRHFLEMETCFNLTYDSSETETKGSETGDDRKNQNKYPPYYKDRNIPHIHFIVWTENTIVFNPTCVLGSHRLSFSVPGSTIFRLVGFIWWAQDEERGTRKERLKYLLHRFPLYSKDIYLVNRSGVITRRSPVQTLYPFLCFSNSTVIHPFHFRKTYIFFLVNPTRERNKDPKSNTSLLIVFDYFYPFVKKRG